MAATDAKPLALKNSAYRFYFAVRKNDGTLITTWTGMDSEVSLDGAAFADCTNEATEIGTTGCGYIDFTAAEMNADAVIYKLTVTNTGALPLVITFFPEETGDINVDVTAFGGTAGTFASGRAEVNASHAAGTAWGSGAITAASIAADAITDAKVASDVTIASVTGAVGSVTGAVGSVTGNVGGSVASVATGGITAASFAANAINAAKLDPDVTTELQAGLATAAALAVVDGIVDDILLDTAEIGTAGAGLTNINLPNQTMDIVGNITGNLSGSVGSVTGAVGSVTGAVGSVGTDGITAASLAADAGTEIASAVFARAFSAAYGSLTFDEMVKLMAAVLVGKASGLATTTATYRNLADNADVVVATVDADGNRSAVTRTP